MSLNASFGQENGFDLNKNGENHNQEKDNDDNNNIFNSIPLEIESEENQKIQYFNCIYIKGKISFHLYTLFNIIQRKINNNQSKFFFALKEKSNYKYSKLVHAQILFMLIETNFRKIKHIWDKTRKDILHDAFSKIKRHIILTSFYDEYDSKKNIETKQSISEVENELKNVEKKFDEISEKVKNLKNLEEKQKNEVKEVENKNKKLEEKCNELIGRNKELKEMISLSRQKSAKYNYDHDANDEKRILELQNKIKMKEKESDNQIAYYQLFYQSMDEMLSHYESKYDTIKSTINTTNQNIQ